MSTEMESRNDIGQRGLADGSRRPTTINRDFAEPGAAALYRLASLADEFGSHSIAENARAVAERVSEGRFYVACVGQFKRGKSSLLNALIGHSVLPAGVIPVTTVPTVIRHGDQVGARIRFQNTDWSDIPISAVEDFVSEDKNPENTKGVAALEIFVPSRLLVGGMCLVDTPGLGSVHAGNSAATRAFIPHIDAAIVVIGTDPPLSGEELDLVDSVSHDVHDLIFVLNKADRSSDLERSSAVAFAKRVLETRLQRPSPPIFEVSALERLNGGGDDRDWHKLLETLQDLIRDSGRLLVRQATDRGRKRVAEQLLKVIREEQFALQRPIEESESRIAGLRKTIEQAEFAMRDLGYMLSGEQNRLSETFSSRRTEFMKTGCVEAHRAFTARLSSLHRRRYGPAFRRDATHMAQAVAQAHLGPWLESESRFAEAAFQKATVRFVELGDDFLRRLAASGMPELGQLPGQLGSDGLRTKSDFHFNLIERVAAPASPFLFIGDLVCGLVGYRSGILGDAGEFLDQLMEVNSSRVQSDVDARVRVSRGLLEAEIKGLLREAVAIAERALVRARTTQAAGEVAVNTSLERLRGLEKDVLGVLPWQSREVNNGSEVQTA